MRTNEGINCYVNEEFPHIATASRADLIDGDHNDPNRYPLVHAYLKKREYLSKEEFYVDFSVLQKETDTPEDVRKVVEELAKFVKDSFSNDFKYKIDGEYYTLADMSGTNLKSKYFLMPAL